MVNNTDKKLTSAEVVNQAIITGKRLVAIVWANLQKHIGELKDIIQYPTIPISNNNGITVVFNGYECFSDSHALEIFFIKSTQRPFNDLWSKTTTNDTLTTGF